MIWIVIIVALVAGLVGSLIERNTEIKKIKKWVDRGHDS